MQQERLKSYHELKADCAGKWPYILEDLAPELAAAIAANGNHVSCPVHGGRDGFRLFRDFAQTGGGVCNTCGKNPTGFGLLAWVRGYDFKDAVRDVAKWLRGEQASPTIYRRPPPAVQAPADPAKARAVINRLWNYSRAIAGTPAEKYLSARGIWSINHSSILRFHPEVGYYDFASKKFIGKFPAMLAPMTNAAGTVIALHRTYLTPQGDKAPVAEPKKLTMTTEPPQGAAIKLFKCSEILGVGEGIETVLAAHAISRMPVWSAYSAGNLEVLEIPNTVRHVVIWGDYDRKGAGQRSSEILAKRMIKSGRTVEVHLPKGDIPAGAKGIDWLDVLLTQGLEGFPEHWRIWQPAA